jgi:hypothetical protein
MEQSLSAPHYATREKNTMQKLEKEKQNQKAYIVCMKEKLDIRKWLKYRFLQIKKKGIQTYQNDSENMLNC